MSIVDTHCHVATAWYEPVESLIFQMDQNGVEKAVLIQIQGQYDNEYQFQCAGEYPERLVSVVLVDPSQPDAPQKLEQLAERGAKGVRIHANATSPGDDPLAIWRKADELGLPVSCSGGKAGFASDTFETVITTFPNLTLIIEHLGGIKANDGEEAPYPIRQKIFGLGKYPNVYMKIHGLGEFCVRNMPVTEPFPFDRAGLPLLQMAYEAFGANKLMWGSDYPPVSGREGYTNALHLPMEELRSKSQQELRLIFGAVAERVYGIEDKL